MKIDARDAMFNAKQQRKLRSKRTEMLYFASLLICEVVFLTAVIVAANIWNIDWSGWMVLALFAPFLVAGAIAAVYHTFSQWHFLDEEEIDAGL